MSAVKGRRTYRSPLRAEQSRRTRRRIVSAAARLFVERGYTAASLREVAGVAGVSADTVYDNFGNKQALLEAVIEDTIRGGNEPEEWLERGWAKEILAEPDPVQRFRRWIRHTAVTVARTSAFHAVVRGAAASDRQLRLLHERLHAERFATQARLAEPFFGRQFAADEAVTFSTLTSPEIHHLLTVVNGWDNERYAGWLETTVMAALAPDLHSGSNASPRQR